jgi:hypothetical protein
VEEALGLFQMGRMAGAFEALLARVGERVDQRPHDRGRGLVVLAGDHQRGDPHLA